MTTKSMVLKHDELFIVCDETGDIAESVVGAGFYFRDMRHLSKSELRIEGCALQLLDNATDAIDHLLVYLTNRDIVQSAPGGESALPHTISVLRRRELHGQLTEWVTIANYGTTELSIDVSLCLAADFRDIFDIRGLYFNRDRRPLRPRRNSSGFYLAYDSVDGTRYLTNVTTSPPPSRIDAHLLDGHEDLPTFGTPVPGHERLIATPSMLPSPEMRLVHTINLTPGASASIEYVIEPRVIPAAGPPEVPARLTSETHAPEDLSIWHTDVARIWTSNASFNRVLHRSLSDLGTLITPLPQGSQIIAAGIPWFVAPFGRDSAIAARQLLPFNAGIVAATLRYLSATQGRVDDPWRDEQPGKIIHEIRFGEMSRRNLVPHSRYYGTVDATPLYLLLMAEYLDWTGDWGLFNELRPNVERALDWIDKWGDSNGDGFVDYSRQSERGLVNQGWKDSDNSLQRIDGQPVAGPIALVEVQGYVYAAKKQLAAHLARHGEGERAARLSDEAEQLRARTEEAFWIDSRGYYAEAIDGEGRPIDTLTSNQMHLLRCGLPDPARAARVADVMFSQEMFSGWGIRTLSTAMPHYNPISYHNGSVWPHDNGFCLWGLRCYGRLPLLEQLAGALIDAAVRFPYRRLPELMCGFTRGGGPNDVPVSYPVSCSPQAWAAGVPFVIVETLLGIRPDAEHGQLILDPWLPDWLDRVEVSGLQVGGRSVDLRVSGRHDRVDLQVLANRGRLAVTISPT